MSASAPEGPLQWLLAPGESGLRRVSFEIDAEQVTFVARGGALQAICTCGLAGCVHASRALELCGAPGSPEPALALGRTRSSVRPPAPPPSDRSALTAAIDDLVLATARAGTATPDSPSIKAALDQIVKHAGSPLPLGLSRFMGRFQEALQWDEVGRVARLLDGIAGLAAVLREDRTTSAAEQVQRAWLSVADGGGAEPLSDLTLVEVAREWLSGLTRGAIERRYLVDVANGGLFCEDRRRGAPDGSVGPCPRVVQVAYGEFDPATRPHRVRLFQYTIAAEPNEPQWSRLASLGERRLAALLARYARELSDAPALAEPFALVAPSNIEATRGGVLRDTAGDRLELSDDAGGTVLDTVHALAEGRDVVWISGRLRGTARGIVMRPTSLLLRTESGYCLRRVT